MPPRACASMKYWKCVTYKSGRGGALRTLPVVGLFPSAGGVASEAGRGGLVERRRAVHQRRKATTAPFELTTPPSGHPSWGGELPMLRFIERAFLGTGLPWFGAFDRTAGRNALGGFEHHFGNRRTFLPGCTRFHDGNLTHRFATAR